jgi:hypothetical protein
MAKRAHGRATDRKQKLKEASEILIALGFGPKQYNDTAAYAFLALADLKPAEPWGAAKSPLRGITPIIEFINDAYGVKYAPNTRETIRDDAVKHFVEAGLLIRNPDKPDRPPNSGSTEYQIEPSALSLIRSYGNDVWSQQLDEYLADLESIRAELERRRDIPRIPVHLPDGTEVSISPGGQNPLIKSVVEEFCPRFAPGALVVYIGDAENKFLHLDAAYLEGIGIVLAPAAKMPDVIVHDVKHNWLLLVEAVVTTGTVDAKRRKELKELFANCSAGLVFVTAFQDRQSFNKFQPQIAWETEVRCAAEPDHMIHYNGERFLGPHPDVLPK